MSLTQFKFCPACRAEFSVAGDFGRCTACPFIHYENPAPGAGIILIEDGKALIAYRAIDPHKGVVDIVGGFIQRNETPEQAALRELKEETGLDAEITAFLGAYPDTYGPGGKPTLNFIYVGQRTGGTMRADDDVAELHWIPVSDVWSDHGFTHVQHALCDLQSRYKMHLTTRRS